MKKKGKLFQKRDTIGQKINFNAPKIAFTNKILLNRIEV